MMIVSGKQVFVWIIPLHSRASGSEGIDQQLHFGFALAELDL